jgi:hypothetical protein
VSKGRHHRATIILFRLEKAGRVRVTVTQLAPRCGAPRSFQFGGHKGVNKFRFRGRLGGRRLVPGTYRIVAQAVRSGRRLFVTRVVIVGSGRPSRTELAALWLRNSCAPAAPVAGGGVSAGGSITALFAALVTGGLDGGLDPGGRASTSKGGVLGAEASRKLPSPDLPATSGLGSTDPRFQPTSARDWLRLFLFAVLGISLLLAIRHTVRDLRH